VADLWLDAEVVVSCGEAGQATRSSGFNKRPGAALLRDRIEDPSRQQVDEAARATLAQVDTEPGIRVIVEDERSSSARI
jgi:hypothetical protein